MSKRIDPFDALTNALSRMHLPPTEDSFQQWLRSLRRPGKKARKTRTKKGVTGASPTEPVPTAGPVTGVGQKPPLDGCITVVTHDPPRASVGHESA